MSSSAPDSVIYRKGGQNRWSQDSSYRVSRKRVTFAHLYIIEFSVRPCLNPGCSNESEGAALALHEEIKSKGPINIDLYEFSRKPLRKFNDELRMSPFEREEVLKLQGYSRLEIEDALLLERKMWDKALSQSTFKSGKFMKLFRDSGKSNAKSGSLKGEPTLKEGPRRAHLRRASSDSYTALSEDTKDTLDEYATYCRVDSRATAA